MRPSYLNMGLFRKTAMAALALALVSPVSAQDDGPWWKSIFSKSKSKSSQAVESSPAASDMDRPAEAGLPGGQEGATTDASVDGYSQAEAPPVDWGGHSFTAHGTSNLHLSEEAEPLTFRDTTVVETTPGFRVQLHLGRLDTARSLRTALEADTAFRWPVYVSSMPPLFSVTAGEFLSPLVAHREMLALKLRFPNALVIPVDLPLTVLIGIKEEEIKNH